MTRFGLVMVGAALVTTPAAAREVTVADHAAFSAAVPTLKAGDTLVLADGEWRDFAAVFTGEGKKGAPITMRAQTPGKVVLTGRSSLNIGGRYLTVSDLVFRNGYTPGTAVIETRVGKRYAENARLTGIVIDGYSNPNRRAEDHWVALYGRAVRVDHSHFVGKQNAGATLVVVREDGAPLDNRMTVDHNYFGPRPVLGGKNGETIRVGTSKQSSSDSKTVIEDNYFDRCDGEVAIVSIQAGGNVVRRNVFVDAQGSVVLRHGHGNLVERNVFLGRNLPRTGGVRVIGERQTVRGNYMEGLRGTASTSALAVTSGVPNAPVDGYRQVRQAVIERNSVVDAARVTLAAGANAERSAPPVNTRFVSNLFTGVGGKDPFRAEASIAGISWDKNVAGVAPGPSGISMQQREVRMSRAANGLLYPLDPALSQIGAPRDLQPVARDETGVTWYTKPGPVAAVLGTGKTIAVTTSAGLVQAVAQAQRGDTIRLRAGAYRLAEPLLIDRPLTVTGTGATLTFSAPTLFQLGDGGSLRLQGLSISGAAAPRQPGNAIIRTSAQPMLSNYTLEIADCRFVAMNAAPGFDVIATTRATLAARMVIGDNSSFTDVSGAIIAGYAEVGSEGYYGVESVTVDRAQFTRVGTIADLHRGGTDESSFGPRFAMIGASVTDSGPVTLSGVQEATITLTRFVRSKGVQVTHGVGSPVTLITANAFEATPAPVVRELFYQGEPRAVIASNQGLE